MADKKKAAKKKQEEPAANKKDSKALEAEIQIKLIVELRGQIKEDKDRIAELKKSNQELKEKLGFINHENNSNDITVKSKIDMQKTVSDKQKAKINELTQQYENAKKEILRKYDDKTTAIARKCDEERKKLEDKFNLYNAELASLEPYRKEKAKKEKELLDIQENYKILSAQLQNQKFEVEKNTTLEVQMIKQKYEKEVSESKKNDMQKAVLDINLAEKKILQLNEHLIEDIEMQNDEVQYLREKELEAEESSKLNKRDMLINMEKVDSYSKRQADLSKKLKELKYELELKNQTLKDYAKEFEKDKELTRFKYDSKISELQSFNQKLSQQLSYKNSEYKNIKKLSTIILEQRSEVETFFLEALEQVKEEIKKKNVLNKKSNIPEQAEDKQYGEKVDLKDLELEDRERVIRLLFAKMNSGTTPQLWKNSRANSKGQPSFEESKENGQAYSKQNPHEDYNPWAIENNE